MSELQSPRLSSTFSRGPHRGRDGLRNGIHSTLARRGWKPALSLLLGATAWSWAPSAPWAGSAREVVYTWGSQLDPDSHPYPGGDCGQAGAENQAPGSLSLPALGHQGEERRRRVRSWAASPAAAPGAQTKARWGARGRHPKKLT